MTSFNPEFEIEKIVRFIQNTFDLTEAEKIIIGMSGGVDSAVCLNLCVRAIGADKIMAIHLPTATTPQQDTTDVYSECSRHGIIPTVRLITGITTDFASRIPDRARVNKTVMGNLSARCRMVLLYTYANAYNGMVCGTGNQTEYYLGYTTKWGDNAADFYPILHLYKTEVWEIARALGVIPDIIKKPPSAGLWEGQTDEGEIGMPYSLMDECISRLQDTDYTGPETPEMLTLYDRHCLNLHKSVPGVSLLV